MIDEQLEIEQERQRDMRDEAKQGAKDHCRDNGRFHSKVWKYSPVVETYDAYTGETYYDY
jgi:hypothetical protein